MTAIEVLSEALEKWLERRPHLTLSSLARLCDVSYSSMRRIAQREGNPDSRISLAVAATVLDQEAYSDFAAKYFPKLKKNLSDLNHASVKNENLDDFLKSPEHFKVLVLACGAGIDEKVVTDKYGLGHVEYFRDLVAAGVLQKKIDKWVMTDNVGYVSFDVARLWLSTMLSIYDRRADSLAGAGASYAGWQELNKDGVIALHEATREYCQKVHELTLKPEYSGNIVTGYGAIMNVMTNIEVFQ